MFKRHNIKGELWEIKIVYFVFNIVSCVLHTRSRGLFLENIIYASVVYIRDPRVASVDWRRSERVNRNFMKFSSYDSKLLCHTQTGCIYYSSTTHSLSTWVKNLFVVFFTLLQYYNLRPKQVVSLSSTCLLMNSRSTHLTVYLYIFIPTPTLIIINPA